MTTNGHDPLDDELSAAARSLHREWNSPELWPSIAGRLKAAPTSTGWAALMATRWYGLAAAAVLLLAVSSAVWMAWRTVQQTTSPEQSAAQLDRLLSDAALAEVERAESQYTRAIDELARTTAPKLQMPDSQLLVNLGERLMAIDAAIDEARMQIDMNPFNAQLRRQLMFIYQEKRQTLEQVQAYDENSL
jgi:hypothetical protein